jgi:hypothetical protein
MRSGVLFLVALAGLLSPVVAAQETVDPFEVIAAFDRFAAMEIWPGYEAGRQPIAIFDGERTLLLRHPAPPEGFEPLAGREGVWVWAGRHPAMRWNSNAEIGGVVTATLILTIEPGRAVEREASILLHEAFHVWSKPRHPTWRPNENDRYSYPVGDAGNYRMLLAEDEMLARALEAGSDDDAAAWAAAALATRLERTARLRPEHLGFEAALEMQEGTAVYVDRTARGVARDTARLRDSQPPQGIRWRCYEAGAVLAALLDRLRPTWKNELEEQRDLTFTQLLEGALAGREAPPAEFSADEIAAIEARAEDGIRGLREQRAARYEEFRSRPHRVTIEVGSGVEPFRLANFDPINLEILDEGEALHLHGIVLERAGASVEIDNPRFARRTTAGVLALTSPAGEHPFIGGLLRVEVAGMKAAPTVRTEDGVVTIEGEGLTATIEGAEIVDGEGGPVIRIAAPKMKSD